MQELDALINDLSTFGVSPQKQSSAPLTPRSDISALLDTLGSPRSSTATSPSPYTSPVSASPRPGFSRSGSTGVERSLFGTPSSPSKLAVSSSQPPSVRITTSGGSSSYSPSGSPQASGSPISMTNSEAEMEKFLSDLETEMAAPKETDESTGIPTRKGSRIGMTVGQLLSPRRQAAERVRDLAELTNFATNDLSVSEMIEFDAQLCFEQALTRGIREEVELAAQGLTNLAVDLNGRNSIRQSTVKAALDSIVLYAADEEIQVKLLGALVNLCYAHPQNRQFLVQQGLFPCLAKIIHKDSHNSSLLRRVLSLLTNVLSDADNQDTLLRQQPDLPPLLVRAAVNNDHDEEIMDVSLKVFSVISQSSPASQRLWADSGLIRILPRCIAVTSTTRRIESLRAALATAVNFSATDAFVRDVQAAGCIPVLGRIVTAGDLDPQNGLELAVQALQNVSSDDSCAAEINQTVGAAAIVALIRQHTATEKLLVILLLLTQNLAASASIRASLNGAGATPVVAGLLSHHSGSVSSAARSCHGNLTI